MTTNLSGRRGQAARNDGAILDAARDVFLADPKAPIAAVADRAGVGISALYRRYKNKDDLLRTLCHDGLRTFIAGAETAAASPTAGRPSSASSPGSSDADVHSLTVHLAGTFTSTAEMGQDAARAAALAGDLVTRAHATGRLRKDVVVADITLVLEACAAIRVPDRERTAELRRRHLALMLDGMRRGDADPLPGPPPDTTELNWRWAQSRQTAQRDAAE